MGVHSFLEFTIKWLLSIKKRRFFFISPLCFKACELYIYDWFFHGHKIAAVATGASFSYSHR